VLNKSPKQLDASFSPQFVRPTPRILQFGGGSFMRAFFDMKVDLLNEAIGGDWGILIVRAVADDLVESLNDQDGLYTVIERGLDEHGCEVSKPRIVSSVRAEFFAQRDWDAIRGLARNPVIRVVTSHATDAGFALNPWDIYDDRPPKSFPAKLTRLLHERWKYLGHIRNSGWQVIPCEPIEGNGTILGQRVEQQARIWGLEPGFLDWLKSRNAFYNTLVDRIVPGFPHGEERELADELGYIDRFMVVAESFHFLAIEKRKDQPDLTIPLAKHDPHTVIAEDISAWAKAHSRGRGIDNHVLVHSFAKDRRMLSDVIMTDKGVMQTLETVDGRG
jgi:tagaturonate reductase